MAATRLNFATGAARPAGWRLAVLGVGTLALAAACLNWTLQARSVARLEAALALAQPREIVQAPLSAEQQRAQVQQEKLVGDAVRQLNLPVTRLIKTVQAPRDIRVALIGLDLANQPEPGNTSKKPSGGLKISAEADSAQDMMNYVAYLNEQPLFTTVYLVKHEMAVAAPGQPYRFQLEAVWRE